MNDNFIINGKEVDLLLYGEIVSAPGPDSQDEVVGRAVVSQIMQLSGQCDRIRIHINSEGGEVYAGIAVFNAIRSCKKDVTIYTDGIAASIAGIIAMCGRRHYMSKYARLMIHSVSAGVYGDKNDLLETIDEIKALEDTLASIICERMGIGPEEVKSRYFDGKDHWFTAREAVDAGLADGIYDLDVEIPETDEPGEIYQNIYNNRAAICSKIHDKMEITRFKEKPRFTNVMTEDDVLRAIDELNGKIDDLESENASLKGRLEELENEDIEKILSAAVECGKIEEGDKEEFRKLLNSNKGAAEKVINSLRPRRTVKDDISKDEKPEVGAWDKRMEEIRNKTSMR